MLSTFLPVLVTIPVSNVLPSRSHSPCSRCYLMFNVIQSKGMILVQISFDPRSRGSKRASLETYLRSRGDERASLEILGKCALREVASILGCRFARIQFLIWQRPNVFQIDGNFHAVDRPGRGIRSMVVILPLEYI